MVTLNNKIIISFVFIVLVCSIAGALGSASTNHQTRADTIEFELELILEDQADQDNLTLAPGAHYVASIELENLGNVNDTYNLSISGILLGWEVTFDNYKTKKSVSLMGSQYPDYKTKIMLILKIPDNANRDDAGKITVTGTSEASKNSGNTIERSASINVIIDYPMPYLFLETQDNIKYIYPAESTGFLIIITNVGNDNQLYTPQNSTVTAAEGTDEDGTWSVAITPAEPFNIVAGGSKELTVTITAPLKAPAGSKFSFLAEGSVSGDEVVIIPIEVSVFVEQLYNISIDSPATIQIDFPEVSRNYPIAIKNIGNGNDKIELQITETPAFSKVRLSNQKISIGSNEYENITVTITPTIDTPLGTHQICIQAYRLKDSAAKVLIQELTTAINIQYRPDLTINYEDLEFSDYYPIEYEEIYINATIYNNGDTSATNVTIILTPQAKGGSLLNPIGTETIPAIAPQSSVDIGFTWEVDPSVEFIIINIDPDNDHLELSEVNNNISKNLFVVIQPNPSSDIDQGDSGISYTTWGVSVVVTALCVAIIAVGASVANTVYGKYALVKSLLPFYSRVKREDVLNHEVREQVYDYVREHPGDHFRSILTHLELTNGTLVHHLNTLEKKEFIRSERDGPYKRFYPIGTKLTEDVLEINGLQKKILDAVSVRPGITQKGLAKSLQTSTPTINYHVKALRNSGLLRVKRDGKVTRCFVEGLVKSKGAS